MRLLDSSSSPTGSVGSLLRDRSLIQERSDVLARHLQTHPINNNEGRQRQSTAADDNADRIPNPRNQSGPNTTNGAAARHSHDRFPMSFTASSDPQRISTPTREQPSTPSPSRTSAADYRQLLAPKSSLQSIPAPSSLDNLLEAQSQEDLIDQEICAVLHPATPRWWDATEKGNLNDFASEDWSTMPPLPAVNSESISMAEATVLNASTYTVLGQLSDNQADQVRDEQISNAHDYGFGHISSCGDLRLSPSVMDGLDFGNPGMSGEETSSPPVAFSVEQLRRIRRLWSRQRPKLGVRLIRKLWHQVVHHETDNIFSKPQTPGCGSIRPPPRSHPTSRWGMDGECRNGLIQYCKDLDNLVGHQGFVDTDLHLTPWSASEEGLDKSPLVSDDEFPTIELLDSSLDFFFLFVHPSLPFMHKVTFDARSTLSSLLLTMCLVGLLHLDPRRTKSFILQYLNVRCFAGEISH